MSTTQMLDISTQILEHFVTSDFPPGWKQDYVPEGCLDQLITRDAIIREFSKDDEPDENIHIPEDLIRFILQSAKKVLATSLWSGVESRQLQRAMKTFRSAGFKDSSLPVKVLDPREAPWSQLKWNSVKFKTFQEMQWKFVVPIFSEDNIKLELENRHILPFKSVEREVKTGGFSEVYEFDGSPANAAIKAIKPPTTTQTETQAKKEWEREEKALEEMRDIRHPHIIEVKAIFTWKGKGNFFMFQWADGGSLRDYYKNNPRPKLTNDFMKEIVNQFVGLAHALDALHNYKKNDKNAGSYRHGDLKPENILRFENGTQMGFLRIADLGLAKHHFDETGLRDKNTSTRHGTPFYEPPEVFRNPKEARSRQYDIWSMGCVILEVLVWLLYGTDALEAFINSMNQSFSNSSPYWALDEQSSTVKVHPYVEACMDFIAKDQECQGSTAISDLLNIVKTKLIVVQLPSPRHTDQIGAGRGTSASNARYTGQFRARATDFLNALRGILEKGEKDNEYWFTGRPRDNLKGPASSTPSTAMASSSNGKTVPTIKAPDNATERGFRHANERQDVSWTSTDLPIVSSRISNFG
ncbi:hypothetical protein VPNG_09346 [Cytospora leucostoma]|uniref:Protein kinase domain-containing protein n=1 Tax=Cytospora leucostoma TaxID=1230097 RepID=A0A423VSZ8_9PEZI|nr:hypothetical protein VPNG_09346 [Cytospora leucostoma]